MSERNKDLCPGSTWGLAGEVGNSMQRCKIQSASEGREGREEESVEQGKGTWVCVEEQDVVLTGAGSNSL